MVGGRGVSTKAMKGLMALIDDKESIGHIRRVNTLSIFSGVIISAHVMM